MILINYKDLGHLFAKFVPWQFPAELTEIATNLRKPLSMTPINPPIFAYFAVKKCQFCKITQAFEVTILTPPAFFNFRQPKLILTYKLKSIRNLNKLPNTGSEC